MRHIILAALLLAAPAIAQAQEPAWLTADQVRTVLRARGYSEIGAMDREGDTFRITDATRYGEKVRELRIDALTGLVRESPPLTPTQARTLLQERGYAEVQPLGTEGNVIRLRASQSGTPVEIKVNADTGAVSR